MHIPYPKWRLCIIPSLQKDNDTLCTMSPPSNLPPPPLQMLFLAALTPTLLPTMTTSHSTHGNKLRLPLNLNTTTQKIPLAHKPTYLHHFPNSHPLYPKPRLKPVPYPNPEPSSNSTHPLRNIKTAFPQTQQTAPTIHPTPCSSIYISTPPLPPPPLFTPCYEETTHKYATERNTGVWKHTSWS